MMRASIIHPLGIRGIALYCHNLANAVAPHVDACEFITSTLFEPRAGSAYELVPSFRLWNVGARDNRRLSWGERMMRPLELAGRFLRFETSYRRAVGRVRDSASQIAHVHEVLFPWEARHILAMQRCGARLVVTCHNVEGLSSRVGQAGRGSAGLRREMERIYASAAAIILHSRANLEEFRRLYPEAADRVRFIHHGCEAVPAPSSAVRAAARARLDIADGDLLALCFGEVKPYKGIEFLVEAAASVARADPALRVVVAGLPTDPRYASLLRERQAALDPSGRAVRLDFRYIPDEEVAGLFAAADLCVLPYRRVYQSGVLSQALAYGLPVLVTDAGGLGETVRATGAGLVAIPSDAADLARCLETLAADAERRREYGEAAARAARGPLSWEAAGRATATLYEEVASAGAPSC